MISECFHDNNRRKLHTTAVWMRKGVSKSGVASLELVAGFGIIG